MGYEVILTPARIKYLWTGLLRTGFSKEEAGNFIASLMGLANTKTGWTVKELNAMLFLDYRKTNMLP